MPRAPVLWTVWAGPVALTSAALTPCQRLCGIFLLLVIVPDQGRCAETGALTAFPDEQSQCLSGSAEELSSTESLVQYERNMARKQLLHASTTANAKVSVMELEQTRRASSAVLPGNAKGPPAVHEEQLATTRNVEVVAHAGSAFQHLLSRSEGSGSNNAALTLVVLSASVAVLVLLLVIGSNSQQPGPSRSQVPGGQAPSPPSQQRPQQARQNLQRQVRPQPRGGAAQDSTWNNQPKMPEPSPVPSPRRSLLGAAVSAVAPPADDHLARRSLGSEGPASEAMPLLCEGLVVPEGQECTLLVPRLAVGRGVSELTLSDTKGLPVFLARRALAQLSLSVAGGEDFVCGTCEPAEKSQGGSPSLTIHHGFFREKFGVLGSDTDLVSGSFALVARGRRWAVKCEPQVGSLNVLDEKNRLLASAETDGQNTRRLRIGTGVDASLVVLVVLGVDWLQQLSS